MVLAVETGLLKNIDVKEEARQLRLDVSNVAPRSEDSQFVYLLVEHRNSSGTRHRMKSLMTCVRRTEWQSVRQKCLHMYEACFRDQIVALTVLQGFVDG